MALDGTMIILSYLGGKELPEKTDIGAILRKRLTIRVNKRKIFNSCDREAL